MIVTSPFVSAASIPAKVKSSADIVMSIRAVYGALAISSVSMNMGFAYPMSSANKALLAISDHGFSASVIGPPYTRNNCQTVMRNSNAHAVYCITSKAFPTNGKYSSMAVISVPSALRNKPETASISVVTVLLIHVIMPSKIQSSKFHHLQSRLTGKVNRCTVRRQ